MNANQIVNMVMRLFVRKALSRGIDAGFDMMSKRRGAADPQDPDAARRQQAAGRENAKRAKDMMRLGRRIGRF